MSDIIRIKNQKYRLDMYWFNYYQDATENFRLVLHLMEKRSNISLFKINFFSHFSIKGSS